MKKLKWKKQATVLTGTFFRHIAAAEMLPCYRYTQREIEYRPARDATALLKL